MDGSANLKYVYTVAKQIAQSVEQDCVVVVKSTVPIGTNDKVEEFIRSNLAHPSRLTWPQIRSFWLRALRSGYPSRFQNCHRRGKSAMP